MKCKWDYFGTIQSDITCVRGPFWTVHGRKGEVSPGDGPSLSCTASVPGGVFLWQQFTDGPHVGQSSGWELYYPEHSALTAPSGPFLRFSCHSFPLEDSHSTQAPPQIACLVVIKLVSDLVLVTQPRRLVVHIGCCCLWTEEIQSFPLCALFVCSELWGRVAGQGPGCDGEGGEVCVSLLTGRWERALSNS